MDAILWAIAIPIGIILSVVALFVGGIIVILLLPVALVIGGIMVGGPIGGILVLIGVIVGAFVYADFFNNGPRSHGDY